MHAVFTYVNRDRSASVTLDADAGPSLQEARLRLGQAFDPRGRFLPELIGLPSLCPTTHFNPARDDAWHRFVALDASSDVVLPIHSHTLNVFVGTVESIAQSDEGWDEAAVIDLDRGMGILHHWLDQLIQFHERVAPWPTSDDHRHDLRRRLEDARREPRLQSDAFLTAVRELHGFVRQAHRHDGGCNGQDEDWLCMTRPLAARLDPTYDWTF